MEMFKQPNSISLAAIALNTVMFGRSATFSSLLKSSPFLNGGMVKANLKLTTIGKHESVMEGQRLRLEADDIQVAQL